MEHLEFIDKLNEFGIQIRSTKIENKIQTIEIPHSFGIESDFVDITNFECKYKKESPFSRPTALQAVLSMAIDIDSWKHSSHNEISPENYEKFREIIQNKIIKRASEIEMLVTVYFQLNHEISSNHETNNLQTMQPE